MRGDQDGARGEGDQEERHGDVLEAADAAPAHGEGPEQVELFFERDAPERAGGGSGIAGDGAAPVSDEKEKAEQVRDGESVGEGEEAGEEEGGDGQEGEIERPDAQDAAHVEGVEVDRAGDELFAAKQFGDEVGAEGEEEVDAELAGDKGGGDPMGERGGEMVLPEERGAGFAELVIEEDGQEGEEPEDVQLGTIKPAGALGAAGAAGAQRGRNGGCHDESDYGRGRGESQAAGDGAGRGWNGPSGNGNPGWPMKVTR